MKFKGTIIITDPGYIIKESPLKHPEPKDFNLPDSIYDKPFKDYSTPDEIAFKKACDKYYAEKDKYDDWRKCKYGEHIEVLGFTNYISEETLYGDWGCTTYQISGNPKEHLNEINKIYYLLNEEEDENGSDTALFKEYKKRLNNITKDLKDIGSFCADAGMVAVFLLDEVLKYNPDFDKWIEDHPWCVTTIENFDGDVEYYVDRYLEAHIIGTGNIDFFTTQTSL